MSQPHDPNHHLERTHAARSPTRGMSDRAGGPDPRLRGEPRSRTLPRRGPGRQRAVDGPRDRLHDALVMVRGDARAGLAVLVAVAVIAGVLWYRVGSGGAATTPRLGPSRAGSLWSSASTPGSDAVEAASGSRAPSTKGNRVVVHVAGAVARPGVVELASGSRVIDAVEAAGGGLPEADLDRLNLAAKIVDGQRVVVQKVNDPRAPKSSGSATPRSVGGAPGARPVPRRPGR